MSLAEAMADADASILSMLGVQKRFGATLALRGVDLEVRRGEVHALVGENGAGKSTLMKILAGAHAPDAGEMRLGGKPYQPGGPEAARRAGVSMIYQELNLAPHLTVEENVFLGMEKGRLGWTQRRQQEARTREALALLGHSDIAPRTRVGQLAIGAQQLVEIARAIVSEARLIVLDEPTSSLTLRDAERLFQVIGRLREQGVSIIYISHFLEEVQRVAQRYTVLREGASVASGEVASTPVPRIIEHMVGRKLGELYPRVPHERGAAALSLEGLAGERLPRGVDLTLHRGEILGVAGLVGAGRTELLRAIYGLDPIRQGRVRVEAVGGRGQAPAHRVRQGLGFLSESRKEEGLALDMSIADNLTLSAFAPVSRGGWVRPVLQKAAAARWVDRLGVKCHAVTQPVGSLSGGNQQKVAIARLLHQGAEILLLDEPTRGIDVGSKVAIYRLMGELAAAGKAILFVSSYLPEILGVADRIAVMTRGKLSAVRERQAWTEESILACATGGDTTT